MMGNLTYNLIFMKPSHYRRNYWLEIQELARVYKIQGPILVGYKGRVIIIDDLIGEGSLTDRIKKEGRRYDESYQVIKVHEAGIVATNTPRWVIELSRESARINKHLNGLVVFKGSEPSVIIVSEMYCINYEKDGTQHAYSTGRIAPEANNVPSKDRPVNVVETTEETIQNGHTRDRLAQLVKDVKHQEAEAISARQSLAELIRRVSK